MKSNSIIEVFRIGKSFTEGIVVRDHIPDTPVEERTETDYHLTEERVS